MSKSSTKRSDHDRDLRSNSQLIMVVKFPACAQLVDLYELRYVKQHYKHTVLKKVDYSQLSLRRTPLGPALSVRLREVSVLLRVE